MTHVEMFIMHMEAYKFEHPKTASQVRVENLV